MSKFSVAAFHAIKRKPFVELPKTTLYTAKGPAVGTIWLDVTQKSRETLTVIDADRLMVHYDNDSCDDLQDFHEQVSDGRLVLVGVRQPVLTYTPKVFS